MRASVSAARGGVRRDGAECRQGGVPGEEGRGGDYRHQPVHVHERHRVRSDLSKDQPRSGRPADPQFLLRWHAGGFGSGPRRVHGAGADVPEEGGVVGQASGPVVLSYPTEPNQRTGKWAARVLASRSSAVTSGRSEATASAT